MSSVDRLTYRAATKTPEALMHLSASVGHGRRDLDRGSDTPSPSSDMARAAEPKDVVGFWEAAGPDRWFAKDDAFDRYFRESFLHLHERATQGELEAWRSTSIGSLALLILLDQFPRNAFRGSPRMYATDAMARRVADRAIEAGHDREAEAAMRVFFYLPFGHSENLADQERCVSLTLDLGEPHHSHAQRHYDIIRCFGRFPHRNPILGRPMRDDEQCYLDGGGYSG